MKLYSKENGTDRKSNTLLKKHMASEYQGANQKSKTSRKEKSSDTRGKKEKSRKSMASLAKKSSID